MTIAAFVGGAAQGPARAREPDEKGDGARSGFCAVVGGRRTRAQAPGMRRPLALCALCQWKKKEKKEKNHFVVVAPPASSQRSVPPATLCPTPAPGSSLPTARPAPWQRQPRRRTPSLRGLFIIVPATLRNMPAPTLLHTAVWDDNTQLLSSLLLQGGEDLEALDARGNTPLLLAYRMGRTKAARMLLSAGAFPKARTPDHWEAIHISSLTANPDLVRTSVVAFLRETNEAFERRLPQLQASLGALPDFTLTMNWEFKSWLPLVSLLLPSDTFTIYKRGSSLRLDSSLLGMNNLKWERGRLSLLLWGKDMPIPGSVRVLDWDHKSETDARLAFTHPKDQQIQDWVRKLLTQKQKTTDWWSRDTVMAPCLRRTLLGSLFGSGGSASPRGRASASAGAEAQEADASPQPVAHVDNPAQAREDVGAWSSCVVYDLKNLCVRDVHRAPIIASLPLESWWRPEYSQEIGVAAAQEMHAADVSAAAASTSAGSAGGSDLSTQAEPEKQLAPLMSILRGIRLGRINEKSASTAATLAQLEGMGFGEEGGPSRGSGSAVSQVAFEDYFGVPRPQATAEQRDAAVACSEANMREALERAEGAGGAGASGASAASAASGAGSEAEEAAASAVEGQRACAVHVHGDGKLHRPTGAVAETREGGVTKEEQSLDLKVYFSKDFPLTVACFFLFGRLARSHARNLNLTPSTTHAHAHAHTCAPHAVRAIPAGCRGHGAHGVACRELQALLLPKNARGRWLPRALHNSRLPHHHSHGHL